MAQASAAWGFHFPRWTLLITGSALAGGTSGALGVSIRAIWAVLLQEFVEVPGDFALELLQVAGDLALHLLHLAGHLALELLHVPGNLAVHLLHLSLQRFCVYMRGVIVLLLGRAVLEVEADLHVLLDEVLFPREVVGARRAVLVDILRPQAEHRVGGEPRARQALGASNVGVGVCAVGLSDKAELGHDIAQPEMAKVVHYSGQAAQLSHHQGHSRFQKAQLRTFARSGVGTAALRINDFVRWHKRTYRMSIIGASLHKSGYMGLGNASIHGHRRILIEVRAHFIATSHISASSCGHPGCATWFFIQTSICGHIPAQGTMLRAIARLAAAGCAARCAQRRLLHKPRPSHHLPGRSSLAGSWP